MHMLLYYVQVLRSSASPGDQLSQAQVRSYEQHPTEEEAEVEESAERQLHVMPGVLIHAGVTSDSALLVHLTHQ